jgi:hypothetical protein
MWPDGPSAVEDVSDAAPLTSRSRSTGAREQARRNPHLEAAQAGGEDHDGDRPSIRMARVRR